MSSLFKSIHDLLRAGQNNIFEDYLTEIFAEIFDDVDMLTYFFEQFVSITLDNPSHVQITTQRTFIKLPGHETDSKPDLVIQFQDNGKSFIVFFENKLEATEGPLQLQRYAEHLEVYKNKGFNTLLFYVTRYHDPKEMNDLIQLRWYMIYNWLKDHRNHFIDKIITFMEEIQLNETRRFLPQDVFAIQQMNRLQRMMDECLDGIVDENMTQLFGKATGWSNRQVNLRDYSRYLKANDQGNSYTSIWIGCGFHLTTDEYPLVSVMFEVNPNYSKRDEILEAINWFLKTENTQNEWKGYNLNDNTKWYGMSCDRKLLHFLNDDDHINAIQQYFIEKMKELHLLKVQYPDLNWKII